LLFRTCAIEVNDVQHSAKIIERLSARVNKDEVMIKENVYFEGNVKSLAFEQDGASSSVGVMAAGEYTFGTAAPERMSVISGALTIKRADDQDWITFSAGESFDVIGNSSFDLKVEKSTAYLCEYL
jgi:uncharacterized protein YaiE (UPF0345 family)